MSLIWGIRMQATNTMKQCNSLLLIYNKYLSFSIKVNNLGLKSVQLETKVYYVYG